MSDKDYEKECSFCHSKILMSKQSGQWKPYNLNNGPHECQKKNGQQQQTKKQEITLEMVLHKLQSKGIIINVEKLMNEK
jgi:hypothetical protein